ncbi:MAG: hypothetical protein KDA96_12080 [Planctomycetaceae bacterium]|nr:hypothetical protein [Planctomycetaceae bacterium]
MKGMHGDRSRIAVLAVVALAMVSTCCFVAEFFSNTARVDSQFPGKAVEVAFSDWEGLPVSGIQLHVELPNGINADEYVIAGFSEAGRPTSGLNGRMVFKVATFKYGGTRKRRMLGGYDRPVLPPPFVFRFSMNGQTLLCLSFDQLTGQDVTDAGLARNACAKAVADAQLRCRTVERVEEGGIIRLSVLVGSDK